MACQIQASLRPVVQYFAMGIHRTVLVDEDDRPLQARRCVARRSKCTELSRGTGRSQTDIVRHLDAQIEKNPELAKLTQGSLAQMG